MFVENGHKKTFLEVKDYNTKNKNSDNSNDTSRKKIPWIPNSGPKIRKEFKKVSKDITFTSVKNLQSILCQNKPKQLILECTSWIVHAVADILANQRKRY